MAIGRPEKLSHIETVLYEIDALRYAASRLNSCDDWERWSFLECFLLHFRNLIEFLGKEPDGRDTLSIKNPEKLWPGVESIPADKLRSLYRNDLWKKYEVRDEGQENDKISRYLQHCTEQRVDPKTWNVVEMLNEINPSIDVMENLPPSKQRRWSPPPKPAIESLGASHSTASSVASYSPPLNKQE